MVILNFCIYLFARQVWAVEPSDAYTWVRQQIPTHQQQYFYSYGDLTEPFHQQLLSWINTQLARSTKSAINLHQQGTCTESALFQSMNPKKVLESPNIREQKFIESLFIIESSYCFPGATLDNTYNVFMSPMFREQFMPQVTAYTITKEGSCVQSSGVPGILLPTYYCSKIDQNQDKNHIIIYSSMTSVQNDANHQPIYVREEVIVLSQLPSGVALYRASFSRAQDLGTTTKYILRNTVDNSQTKIRDGLYGMIEH